MGAAEHLGVVLGQSEARGLDESLGGSTMAQREGGKSGESEPQSEPFAVKDLLALALQSGFVKSRPGCMHA